jgi:WD40 repeat protein
MSAVPETTAGAGHVPLGPDNPWPGLESYDKASSSYFHGRTEEAAALLKLVRQSPLTLLYSKSGLGKSSLLQAGLFPLLDAEHFLPVWIRLDLSEADGPALMNQVMDRLVNELRKVGADFPQPATGETLWEYLHHATNEFWSADNFPLVPVLVFDQFEEVLVRSAVDVERTRALFVDLGDLIENGIPKHLDDRAAAAARAALDMFSQRYRVMLSFREDFLPDLRNWERRIPSLARHFLRLEPMSASCAIEAVARAGHAVIEPGMAGEIVNFVGRQESATAPLNDAMTIEPVLLSLCCSELNRRRRKGARIDRALIDQAGQDILESFYRDAFADEDVRGLPDVADFIETHLIQGDRFRGDYPVTEAIEKGLLTERQLAALTDRRRLLRVVKRSDAARVELIHDRLVPVVRRSRDERRLAARQAAEASEAAKLKAEQEREQAQAHAMRRQRNIVRLLVVLAGLAVVIAFVLNHLNNRTNEQALRASIATKLGMSIASLSERRMALRGNSDPAEETALRALAAYRISEADEGRTLGDINSLSLLALGNYLERHSHLRRVLSLGALEQTPALAYSPDGKTLAFGTIDGRIHLLDADTLATKARLDCGLTHQAVWGVAFNEAGDKLVAGHVAADVGEDSGAVCVFDVIRGTLTKRWNALDAQGNGTRVYGVAFGQGPQGEVVVAGSNDRLVRVWNVASDHMDRYLESQSSSIDTVALSADRHTVAAGGEDGSVWVIRLDQPGGAPVQLLRDDKSQAHYKVVEAVAFSPSIPGLLFSTGDDGRVRAWDVDGHCMIQQSELQTAQLYGLAVNPDPDEGRMVAVAGRDGAVRLMRVDDVHCPPRPKVKSAKADGAPREFTLVTGGMLEGHSDVSAVAFSPDGAHLASIGSDHSLRIWGRGTDSFSMAELRMPRDEQGMASDLPAIVTSMVATPDSRAIAAGDAGGYLQFWTIPPEDQDPSMEGAVRRWKAHDGGVRALVALPDAGGWTLVSAGADGSVRRWSSEGKPLDGVRFETVPSPSSPDQRDIVTLARSSDATQLAAGWRNGAITIWNTATGKVVRTIDPPTKVKNYVLLAIGFSGDGHYLAVSAAEGSDIPHNGLIGLDPRTELLEPRLVDSAMIVAFTRGSDASHWLASLASGELMTWPVQASDAAKPKQPQFEQRMLAPLGNQLQSFDMSADGGLTVVGGDKGLVQLWETSQEKQRDSMLIGAQFSGHDKSHVAAVAIAPNGRFFAAAGGKKILLWPGPARWADILCNRLRGYATKEECPSTGQAALRASAVEDGPKATH